MAALQDTPNVIVFGGYGTFGRIVASELAAREVAVTVAGRDGQLAAALAAELGPAHTGVAANVRDEDECVSAIQGQQVAINCAGPFLDFGLELPRACLRAGCQYVDISDDRSYCRQVQGMSPAFFEKNLCAAYGCSSLPGVSLAAALRALAEHSDSSEAPELARVTLFIGNDNPKGFGAVSSASRLVGREIAAPQGTLIGFRDPKGVPLPLPFGPQRVLNFESPDYDLLPQVLGVQAVCVKVGFELALSNLAFGTFARVAPRLGRRLLPQLAKVSGLVRGIGCSGGVVMSELFWPDGKSVRVAVVAREQGQRLAALPAVYVAKALCDPSQDVQYGAVTAVDVLGADGLLTRLAEDGYEVVTESE